MCSKAIEQGRSIKLAEGAKHTVKHRAEIGLGAKARVKPDNYAYNIACGLLILKFYLELEGSAHQPLAVSFKPTNVEAILP